MYRNRICLLLLFWLVVASSGGCSIEKHAGMSLNLRLAQVAPIDSSNVPVITPSSPPVCGDNCFFIRTDADRGGSGKSWASAWRSLPSELVRGSIYYLAGGSYAHATLSSPEDGTKVVTIRSASAADHGTKMGWSAGLASAPAIFTGIVIQDGHFTLDGIKIANRSDQSNLLILDGPLSHVTVKNVELEGDPSFMNRVTGVYAVQSPKNFVMQSSYVHDTFGVHFYFIGAENVLLEKNTFARNWSTPAWHSESVQARGCKGIVARYNLWQDIVGTAVIVSGSGDSSDWYVYGNVFNRGNVGNGVISDNQSGSIQNVNIYNNVITGHKTASMNFWNATGAVRVFNNIWFSNEWATLIGVTEHDYNYFSKTSSQFAFLTSPHETPITQGNPSVNSDPFVDSSGGDFHLRAPLVGFSGRQLAPPYDVDPSGAYRGADQSWDIGVFEFKE